VSEAALGLRHQRVQRLRKLLRQASVRRTERAFVAEGTKVLTEALAAGAPVEGLYAAPEAFEGAAGDLLDAARARGVRVFPLERGVLERIADVVTPQGVVGIVGALDCPLSALVATELVVVLEDVRDPGNVGAIVRSADAAGADAVICLHGTSDLYNPKVVRASAGSIFHLPLVVDADRDDVVTYLADRECALLAAVPSGGFDYALDPWPARSALVLGNEANGISDALAARCSAAVSIPIPGGAESLNVAMAATILLFEAVRRRRSAPRP
jgi:TrmH family RNA methyltransferase